MTWWSSDMTIELNHMFCARDCLHEHDKGLHTAHEHCLFDWITVGGVNAPLTQAHVHPLVRCG